EFMGSVEASRSVQIRSQVTGVIQARPYVEGSIVREGEVLFRIDSTTYAAAYRSAQARLADAQARAANAERNVNRLRPLLADSAVARREVEDAEAELTRARATVADAQGAVDRAKKDYDDTTVRAQLAGRAGKANFVVGSRVTGSNDVLTTIDALDPVYVTFHPSAQQAFEWKKDPHVAAEVAPGGTAKVEVTMPDGSQLPRTGRITYVDPVVDPMTGTQAFRATFDNADRLLVPGQFVRVRLDGIVRENAIVIPQRAVQQMLGHQSVMLVAANDSAFARDVEVDETLEGEVVVTRGLAAGDRVIVDGLQKVRPGAKVHAVPLAPSSGAAAGRVGP
ncbi:MAG TPA: efflux RND transporter periplasmic adaptor subunit, partial [Gemmatimonadaceae bacterium]|nr:efflux RND transporter periplasmic adaptor subunit [Gemmatimonadaceae bacterium]